MNKCRDGRSHRVLSGFDPAAENRTLVAFHLDDFQRVPVKKSVTHAALREEERSSGESHFHNKDNILQC